MSAALIIGISGCSSSSNDENPETDGNNSSGGSATDMTPPQVFQFLPSDGAREVPPDAVISVRFNEDMFATTIDSTSFMLADVEGNTVTGEVAFDAITNTATFTPLEMLDMALGNNYTISLANTITDLSGNALAPVTSQFAAMEHDCNPYSPEMPENELAGTWKPSGFSSNNLPSSVEERTITTPGGLGGGYLELELTTTHPDGDFNNDPVMVVYPASRQGQGAPLLPSSNSLNTTRALISVMPSTDYQITLGNFWAVTANQPPVEWSYTERYVGTMDCYEPNDERFFDDAVATSRKIPINQNLQAYMKPALYDNFTANIENPTWYDWYRFELLAPSAVTLEIVATPNDTNIRQTLYDASGRLLLTAEGQASTPEEAASIPYNSEVQILEAGVYHVQMQPRQLSAPNYQPILSDNDLFPDAFRTPYTFRINAEPTSSN